MQQQVAKITPIRPITELILESRNVKPPSPESTILSDVPSLLDHSHFTNASKLMVEITPHTVPNSRLDIRYATASNMLSHPVYQQARAFLVRPAAEALARVAVKLKERYNLGVNVFDGYRPWSVTYVFWEATPPELRQFVANPFSKSCSRHNRGCAVDLSLYDLATGEQLDMPSDFDEMTERAYATFEGCTETQRKNRQILIDTMHEEGFTVYEFEWWHYDFKGWQQYPVFNTPFEEM